MEEKDERRKDRKRNTEMHKEKVKWKEKRKEGVGKRKKIDRMQEGIYVVRKEERKKGRKSKQYDRKREKVMGEIGK